MKKTLLFVLIYIVITSCGVSENNGFDSAKNNRNFLKDSKGDNYKLAKSKRVPQTLNRGVLRKKYIVFIDPGHGGKDPGAISLSGFYEKNITLNASKILKSKLLKFKNIKVYLSRENDKYLYLRDRIRLAQRARADIFISLHADASLNRKARGVSVFTLSDVASDKEAKKLAIRENKSDFVGDIKIKNTDPLIVGNLIKMFQRETMNKSSELSKFIIDDLKKFSVFNRGHRFAAFAVLKSPEIPSILIELGFLTNRNDERKLKNSNYLNSILEIISLSIIKFLKTNEGLN